MKTSARNMVEGKVKEVKTGQVAAVLKVEIEAPAVITSLITEVSVRGTSTSSQATGSR